MDAVIVATGTKISTSILITHYLHEIGVNHIYTRALDDDHGTILKLVGAVGVIHPERDMALRVSRNLSHPNVLDYIPLADEFDLIHVQPPSDFVNKSLKETDLRAKYNVHVIAIKNSAKGKFELVPSADYVIQKDDILIILGKTNDIGRIKALNE